VGVDPQALLARAFSNLYADDYIQKIELASRGQGGRPLVRTLQITRSQSEEPGKALIRFLEPFDIRRTSILLIEREAASDELFVYLPAIGITRRLSYAQRADSFFGTDLSYEDVEPKDAADWVATLAGGAEDAVPGCVVLDIVPREGIASSYEKMRSCIVPDSGVIVWTDFYRKGVARKRLESDLGSVTVVGERHIPFVIRMRPLGRDSETIVKTLSYEVAVDLPEALFSTWNLEAGDADRDRSKAELAE